MHSNKEGGGLVSAQQAHRYTRQNYMIHKSAELRVMLPRCMPSYLIRLVRMDLVVRILGVPWAVPTLIQANESLIQGT